MHPQKNNNNNTNKQTNKQPLSFSVQLQAYHLLSSVTLPHPVTLSFEIIHRHTPSNALSLSVESYTPLPPLPPLSLLLLLSHPFSFSVSLSVSLSLSLLFHHHFILVCLEQLSSYRLVFRAPNDARFACLWHTRTETQPLQVCPVRGIDLLNWLVRSVFTLSNFVLCISLKKWEQFPPSSDTYVTFIAVPCCQLSYIPHFFKHSDLLVLKIMILWEAVCITLYGQNPNTTFKISFESSLMACDGLVALNTVIASKSMKRG